MQALREKDRRGVWWRWTGTEKRERARIIEREREKSGYGIFQTELLLQPASFVGQQRYRGLGIALITEGFHVNNNK